jgi:uncharacterized membrane protein YqjE
MAHREPLPTDGQPDIHPDAAGLGNMLRRLADEVSQLFRNEAALAKLEVKEAVGEYTSAASRIGIAAAFAFLGALALTAALVIGIGLALNGAYWAGALIVGVLFLAIGAILAKRGSERIKHTDLAPEETIRTMQENKRWASREAQDFKRGVMS